MPFKQIVYSKYPPSQQQYVVQETKPGDWAACDRTHVIKVSSNCDRNTLQMRKKLLW